MPTILIIYSINIPKLLISPNILKYGRIISAIETLKCIDKLDSLKTRRNSKELSNMNFLITKSIKSLIRNADFGNS